MRAGLVWTPRHLPLGALFALPAAGVAVFDVQLGIALAVGVLPAASLGLPPLRRARTAYVLVGVAAGAGMVLGGAVSGSPLLALLVLFAVCIAGALISTRGKVGALVLTLGVPMVGIGLSFGDAGSALRVAIAIIAGSVWALLVSLPWPERTAPAPQGTPHPSTMLGYGVRVGLAATIAASIGFALGLDHVGWAVGAVLLVMRPSRQLLVSRAFARAASVVLGAALGGAFMLTTPPSWSMSLLCVLALAVLTALAGSRWYVTGFFGTLLVFMLLLQGDPADVGQRFWERSLETLLGVSLALVFGALVPWVWERLRPRPETAADEPAPQPR